MRKVICAVTFAAALGLGACVTATVEGYNQRVTGLMGMHSDQLQMTWGPPDRVIEGPDGETIFEYEARRRTFVVTGRSQVPVKRSVTVRVDGKVVEAWEEDETIIIADGPLSEIWHTCDTRFVIGVDHLVKHVNFSGNDCKAVPEKEDTK